MITVKKSRGYALRLIIIAICLSILVGCSAKEDDALTSLGEMSDNQNDAKTFRCEVIYPTNSSSKLVTAARELADKIEHQTGMDTVAYGEGQYRTSSDCISIVLGKTGKDFTGYTYADMKRDDYICRVKGSTVALGGLSETATLAAMQRFEEDVLPSASGGYIAADGIAFEYHADYELDGVLLNGYGFGDYTFVVESSEALETVTEFRDAISDKSGDYPKIVTKAPTNANKCIFIIMNETEYTYSALVRSAGGDIYVECGSRYALSVGLDGIYSDIMDNCQNGIAYLYVNQPKVYSYPASPFGVACLAVEQGSNYYDLAPSVADSIKKMHFDVATVAFDSYYHWSCVKAYLGNIYTSEMISLDGERVAVVLSTSNNVEVTGCNKLASKGVNILEVGVRHRDDNKTYSVLCLWPDDDVAQASWTEKIAPIINGAGKNTVVAVARNAKLAGLELPTDCGYKKIFESGNLTHRTVLYTRDAVECYDNEAVNVNGIEGIVACVRLKYKGRFS